METNPEISIIVPVYNVVDYIDECLRSIVGQDFVDFEVILVDDGSYDGSAEKCDIWSKSDSRIQVIHKKNGGLSSARNCGLNRTKGNWIVFVDSDDVLPVNSLSALLLKADKEVDIIQGRQRSFKQKTPECGKSGSRKELVFDGKRALEDMLYQANVSSSVCCKMFRAGLFTDIRFTEGILYEDLEFMSRILPRCTKVKVIPDVAYFYRRRGNSILGNFNVKRLDVLSITERISTRYEGDNEQYLQKAAHDRELSANFNMFLLLHKYSLGYTKNANDCWRKIKLLRKADLKNPKVRLKNKIGILLSFLGCDVFSKFSRLI